MEVSVMYFIHSKKNNEIELMGMNYGCHNCCHVIIMVMIIIMFIV